MSKRVVGRRRGYRITRQPLREVMPVAEANPWLWFAWDAAGEPVVVGVATRRELDDAIAEAEAGE